MTEVNFVCWGNICRSPMAERVARRVLNEAGLTGVTVTSSGVSSEEWRNPMDRRAARTLTQHGYDANGHTAHQITREDLNRADLVIAMEVDHVDRLLRVSPDAAGKVVLLTDFDPEADPGADVPDPWYGGPEDFEQTLATIERAMPGIVERVRPLL